MRFPSVVLSAFLFLSFVSVAVAETTRTADVAPSAGTISDVNGDEMARRLKTITQCRDKVWPNYKLGEYPMYLVDNATKPRKVETLDVTKGKVVPNDPNSEKALGNGPPVAFSPKVPTNDSRTGVAVAAKPSVGGNYFDTPLCPKEVAAYNKINPVNPGTSDPYDLAMDVLTHEAYHAVDQSPDHTCNKHSPNPSGWPTVSGGREMKGSDADKSTVAYYRANMMHFLMAAAKSSAQRKDNIAEALLWYKKLEAEFPNAIKDLNGVDRREGTAAYVGTVSAAIGKHGCDQSIDALKKSALTIGHHRLRDVPMDLERQSYGLGMLAGLLMDEQGYGNWKNEVMKGKTPMEVLASTVKDIPKKTPTVVPAILENKKLFDAAQNCVKKEVLKPVQTAYENEDTEYIAVSVQSPYATTQSGDAIMYANHRWVPNMSFEGTTAIKNWPTTTDSSGNCGPKGGMPPRMIVLIPKSSLRADGTFQYSDGERTVSGKVSTEKSYDNGMDSFDMYCSK